MHPLAESGRVEQGITLERERLGFLKKHADYIIDTSQLLTRELKQELDKIFVQNREFKNLMITVLSFGFKYGIPADADLVFDVRFLPNPYYYENLRKLTGNDKEIQDFVMGYDMAHIFLDKLEDMIAAIDDGYYFTQTNNGQADTTGEFMFGIMMGYEIKNGRLGRAVRDTTISGFAFQMLQTVDMLSDDMVWSCSGTCGKKQPMPVGMGGPAVKCKVNVAGK